MLPLPGQEHSNWDHCINTGIFSLPTHLISTKPPSHNWKCCFLPWGPMSACSNTRHGPALGCVWPQFPSPGWSWSLPIMMIPWRCLIPQVGVAVNPLQTMNSTSHSAKCCCYILVDTPTMAKGTDTLCWVFLQQEAPFWSTDTFLCALSHWPMPIPSAFCPS